MRARARPVGRMVERLPGAGGQQCGVRHRAAGDRLTPDATGRPQGLLCAAAGAAGGGVVEAGVSVRQNSQLISNVIPLHNVNETSATPIAT